MNNELNTLNEQIKQYLPPADWPVIQQGIQFAILAYSNQMRDSGEPYVIHSIVAATTCAMLQLDREAIIAALLHDLPEDTEVTLKEIHKEFGEKVARLVDGVNKLGKIKRTPVDDKDTCTNQEKQEQAENLRKAFLAMADDVRVLYIKLADRLHNMQTLQFESRVKQVQIATETLEIFAPLANRLGIWQIKGQLEDLCFNYLNPSQYQELVRQIDEKPESLEKYLRRVQEFIRKRLPEAGITVMDVSGRYKNVYSIFKKMERKEVPLSQIYDTLSVRIIVEDVRDCYGALGIIHTLWPPIPGEFSDYIANPKKNFHQWLHTVVIGLDTRPLEIQITTNDMHLVTVIDPVVYGYYTEGGIFRDKIVWLSRLLDWNDGEQDAQGFGASLKSDVFKNQVFVFTPEGNIIDLPAGATPLDFAYRIHTNLGHRCGGAWVNDRQIPLKYKLRNCETVKIIQVKNRKGPSHDWLNQKSGYIKTAQAMEKIRQWFRREERDKNILDGRQVLETELKRLGLDNIKYEVVAAHFPKYKKLEDFLAAISYGGVSMAQVTGHLIEATNQAAK